MTPKAMRIAVMYGADPETGSVRSRSRMIIVAKIMTEITEIASAVYITYPSHVMISFVTDGGGVYGDPGGSITGIGTREGFGTPEVAGTADVEGTPEVVGDSEVAGAAAVDDAAKIHTAIHLPPYRNAPTIEVAPPKIMAPNPIRMAIAVASSLEPSRRDISKVIPATITPTMAMAIPI